MKQEQQPITIPPPQEASQQEEAMNGQQQQQDPTTNKTKPSTSHDFGPNPDTLVHGIGEYHFVSQLGEGKFSKVMLAQHYLTGDKFAIKVIRRMEREKKNKFGEGGGGGRSTGINDTQNKLYGCPCNDLLDR
jgi:serine/threonine protein kinase